MKRQKGPTVDLDAIMPILMGVWRRFHKESGPSDRLQTREFRRVVEAVNLLQKGLVEGDALVGKNYFEDPETLGAYFLYHWVLHYQQGLSLLGELPQTPKRVLDICSGGAPFAFAALRHGARQVFATDQNLRALELGAEVCGRYGVPLTIRRWVCLKENLPITGELDLIILGHCLSELFPTKEKGWRDKQNTFISHLLSRLTPHGHLLIVDNSYLEANRRILDLRDHLVGQGVPVQAPCVWRGPCPALQAKNSPCYAQREFEKPPLIKEIQRSAQINLGSLKMSYIIYRSPKAAWPELPSKNYYRIISPPVETFNGKRFYLCGTDGKKLLGSHITNHSADTRAFEYLRRGELISIEGALEKQQALDIIEGSQIKIEAACGKPLEEETSASE